MEAFTYIAELFIALTFVSFAIAVLDLYRHPQLKGIMDGVWVISVLWSGIVGLVGYFWFGRSRLTHKRAVFKKTDIAENARAERDSFARSGADSGGKDGVSSDGDIRSDCQGADIEEDVFSHMERARIEAQNAERVRMASFAPWKKAILAVLFCGAVCAVGNMVGEYIGIWASQNISIYCFVLQMLLDFMFVLIAMVLCSVFLHLTAEPPKSTDSEKKSCSETSPETLGHAISTDMKDNFKILLLWEIAFFLLVFLVSLPFPQIPHDSPLYWFILQLGMFAGCALSVFVNSRINTEEDSV